VLTFLVVFFLQELASHPKLVHFNIVCCPDPNSDSLPLPDSFSPQLESLTVRHTAPSLITQVHSTWLVSQLPAHIRELRFYGWRPPEREGGFADLAIHFSALTELRIENVCNAFTDETWSSLRFACPSSLRTLALVNCRITDDDLLALHLPSSLTTLSLAYNDILLRHRRPLVLVPGADSPVIEQPLVDLLCAHPQLLHIDL
jgi:hypothetical protein